MMSEQKKSAAQSVLATIEKEHVAPTPRWHFVVRNILVWFSGIIFLIAGAIAVSLIIFALSGSAWQLRGVIGRGLFEHMIIIMPIVWIVALIVFVVAADYALRHTKNGHRYPLWGIVVVLIIGSLIGGTVLHAMRTDQMIDESFGRHVPQYKTVEKRRAILMHQPDDGSIMGHVEDISRDQFTLSNRHFEEEWIVDTDGVDHRVEQDARVLVTGEKDGEMHFRATEIIVLPHHGMSEEGYQQRKKIEDEMMERGQKEGMRERYNEKGDVRGMQRERK